MPAPSVRGTGHHAALRSAKARSQRSPYEAASGGDIVTGVPITLYAGRQVPFHELSPDDFEKFVTSVLNVVGSRHGFSAVTATAGPSDEGFDATAKATATGLPVCIQCKRYQKNLGLADVAAEIAKVAMVSALDNTSVAQHRFVTAGGVAKSLNASLLRDPNKTELVRMAIERGNSEPELDTKKAALSAAGMSVDAVISDYVRSTDIVVWSGSDLDRECTISWSQLTGIVERFFTVQRVLLERPRPDFDEPRYLRSLVEGSQRWIRSPGPDRCRSGEGAQCLTCRPPRPAEAEKGGPGAAGRRRANSHHTARYACRPGHHRRRRRRRR